MRDFNRPVTSREYKLMLKVGHFQNRQNGMLMFWRLVKFFVEEYGGQVQENSPKDQFERETHYIDTNDLALRQQGFIVRIRREPDEEQEKPYKLTLKYRSPDRYLSAAQPVLAVDKWMKANDTKHKFEEDILPVANTPSLFRSQFAHSTAIRMPKDPQFDKVRDLARFYPLLGKLGIKGKTALKTVNDLKVKEFVRHVGKFWFGDGQPKIKACFSFWYLHEYQGQLPVVGEVSYDYDLEGDFDLDDERLESFPLDTVVGAGNLFRELQGLSGWIDIDATTKTSYAYEVFKPFHETS